uniref:NADH dehydrogenase subunit 1 n=1 Tax=Gymnopraia lapislazula TaxID=316224 RepID=UPI0026E219AE|nr:NADH dehydrogenase subunit 1 [Gymnopraia lapislazula]WJJ70123.1 NADH dehydrogenase subunit 1 [Gymnopraia lapislazula]
MISVSNILFYILRYILFIIPLLISIAYITLIERKLLGYIQLRKGPNKIGIYGLLQPISDGIKLFTNEMIIPSHSISYLFIIIPILNLTLSLYINSYIIKFGIINEYSLFIILFIVMLISFNILVAGWVSNSKYSLLGSLRACAQIISYEISFTLLLFIFILITNSFNIYSFSTYSSHTGWLIFPFFIPFLLMYISILAENNRTPFDLAEAESELVSGYNVEYSSFSFAFFFLSEYLIIIFFSMFLVIIFLGNNYFIFKTLTILIISLIIRGTLPRYRYDQLMMLCWKYILPVTITFFIISLFIIQNIY